MQAIMVVVCMGNAICLPRTSYHVKVNLEYALHELNIRHITLENPKDT